MIPPGASLLQIRQYLYREISRIYPEGEAAAMVKWVLQHAGFSFPSPYTEPSAIPDPRTIAQINEIVAEIHTGRPIQYILGYTFFRDLKILVNEQVLIPRPETEELTTRVSEYYRPRNRSSGPAGRSASAPCHILDIGTGSGCLALALKKEFPDASVTGSDLDEGALQVARRNGDALGLRVNWVRQDILESLHGRTDPGSVSGKFDLVVSNPPYIPDQERSGLDRNVREFEPASALFVEDHAPLKFYRAIAAFCRRHLEGDGHLWAEIHETKGHGVAALLKNGGFAQVRIHRDIHGRNRFVHAWSLEMQGVPEEDARSYKKPGSDEFHTGERHG